jgi:hypothetical protein
MSRRSAGKLARGFDNMLATFLEGLDAGDRFDAWVQSYRVAGNYPRPGTAPTASSDGGGSGGVVEWWQVGDTVIGIPLAGEGHYRIPLADLTQMPTVPQGSAID